jgi:predicted transcriptional regulator
MEMSTVVARGSGVALPSEAVPPLTLADVRDVLDARVIACLDLGVTVAGVVAADLMSDVLVVHRPGAVLLTGLATVQAVRTAAIADLAAVVLVSGKLPAADVAALAEQEHVPLLVTSLPMFDAAGALFSALAAARGPAPTPQADG